MSKPTTLHQQITVLLIILLTGVGAVKASDPSLALQPVPTGMPVACAGLFISEYVEGSSNYKALEIFNGTGVAIDLAGQGYRIEIYFNGAITPGSIIDLAGTLQDGEVHILVDGDAEPSLVALANQVSSANFFNGDDAVVLARNDTAVDVIGQVGFDPGSQWGSGANSTQDHTLRRLSTVDQGDPAAGDPFDPADQWQGFPRDTFDGLGTHGASCTGESVVISEIRIEQPGSDDDEYVELTGTPGQPLSGLTYLVIGDGALAAGSGVIEAAVSLDGQSLDGNGFFVAAETTFTLGTANLTTSLNFENADNVTHLLVRDFSGASGDDLDIDDDGSLDSTPWAEVVDLIALVKEENPPTTTEFHYGPPSIGPDDNTSPGHVYRCQPAWQIGQFDPLAGDDTPGAANTCNPCSLPATAIHEVQGSGTASPLEGQTHTVRGIVVGDFQDTSQGLSGFFLQEEDSGTDGDPATSEGLFIYDNGLGVDVGLGDLVQVRGRVAEFFTLTELTAVSEVTVCAVDQAVTPTELTLPLADRAAWEQVEGMLVHLSQELTVSENYDLGRYGQLSLSQGGRLFQFTHLSLPSVTGYTAFVNNLPLRSLILDDGSGIQNPDPVVYPDPGLSATHSLRSGDTVTGLMGVLDYRFGAYRIQPVAPVDFQSANPRTVEPPQVAGALRVASLNLLNYFNGDGLGGGFPTPRGADSASEFTRQRNKTISAIVALDADILGLVEMENDGYGPQSALQDLVNGLNDATAPGTYDLINPGFGLGTDAIKVALIFQPGRVSPQGPAATTLTPPFDHRRPPLAQTFRENASGELLTVAVNHLKSKGSCPGDGSLNDDQMDGQSCWNQERVEAAATLAAWLAADPTGSGDADRLILGDLNAYAREDPLAVLEDAGYTNLVRHFGGDSAYSYVFDSQTGYLDHALASPSLLAQVTGLVEWHINADEPRVLDYNEEFKSPAQLASLYSPDPYRASDHDPVLIGLQLGQTRAHRAYLPVVGVGSPPSYRDSQFGRG